MRGNEMASIGSDVQDGGLGRELGIGDAGLIRVLRSFRLDETCAGLVTWIPAVELAWIGGLTAAERERLLALVHGRYPALGSRAEDLLREWLQRRPSDVLCRTARRVLRVQLAGLPPIERPALRARIIGPCVELVHVSGGLLGFAAVSEDEEAWLDTLSRSLQLPDDPAPRAGGVS